MYKSLEKYILDVREMFNKFLKDYHELSGKTAFSWEETKKKTFYDDSYSKNRINRFSVHIRKKNENVYFL